MKRSVCLLVLTLAACSQSTPSPATAPAPSAPTAAVVPAEHTGGEAELVALEEAYSKALVAKDRAFLMNFYASDWRGGNWTGFWTKSRMIGSLMDGRYVVKSMTLSKVEARVIGIVQGIDDEVSTVQGRDTSGRWAFTDVFERRGDRWVAVAGHTSEVKRDAP